MADEDKKRAARSSKSAYVDELEARHVRFKALGGHEDMRVQLKESGIRLGPKHRLEDDITPAHRQLVFDLTASGLSHQDIADVLGISKERVQFLFPDELKSAYGLSHASLSRALYVMGLAGDAKAAADWLRLHNRGNWAAKTQLMGEGGGAIKTETQVTGDRAIVEGILSGMLSDKALVRPPKELPPIEHVAALPAPKRATKVKTVRKPKQESDHEA